MGKQQASVPAAAKPSAVEKVSKADKAASKQPCDKQTKKGKEDDVKPVTKAEAAPAKKSEIDDIFSAGKKKAEEKAAAAAQKRALEEEAAEAAAAKRPKRVEGGVDDLFGAEAAKGRKRTEEGFAIYSEEELGLGRKGGGDTDQCPFDCECCF